MADLLQTFWLRALGCAPYLFLGLFTLIDPSAVIQCLQNFSSGVHGFGQQLRGDPYRPSEEAPLVPDSPRVRFAVRFAGLLIALSVVAHLTGLAGK